MYMYNLKLNKNRLSLIFIIISIVIILSILIFSIYIIFFKFSNQNCCTNKLDNVVQIDESNYTNILKASNENIDEYIGCKIKVTGYIYRLLDFDKNQFVIARDMKFGEDGQSLVVGFLCSYNKASDFPDGMWVEIEGEIIKGNFDGNIAMLKVISIKEATKPQNIFVNPPDNTYIPTINLF